MNKEIMVAQKVVEKIKENGYDAEVSEVNKNGVIAVGITIGNGKIRATIYPNYEDDIDIIVTDILSAYMKSKPRSDDDFNMITEAFVDYEKIKDKIVPYLSGGDVPDAISRLYLDLNVYYRAVFKDVNGYGDCSVLLKKEHLSKWGDITEADIYKQAKENVKNKFNVLNMSDILPVPIPDEGFMKVVCLPDKSYGSSALLFPKLFKGIDNGNSLVIIPSSIHELIVLKDDNNYKEIAEIIMEVNRTQVEPSEVLSNHPYRYADGKITEV